MGWGCRCLFLLPGPAYAPGRLWDVGGFFCSSLKNGVFLIVPKRQNPVNAAELLTQRPLAG
ncbi:hypothetical protein HMPREF1548_06914, partial [Clostridium sp. KLE 1755]